MKRIFLCICLLSTLFSCGEKTNNPGGNGGDDPDKPVNPPVEIPEPPKDIVQANLFTVDFFSTLDEASFFITHDENTIKSHIKAQQAPKPLFYFVDRCDYVTGEENKMISVGKDLKYNALFAQVEATEAVKTNGTGILTVYKPKRYDGIAEDGSFMSGVRFKAPLGTAVELMVYTTKLTDIEQFYTIIKKRSAALYEEAVVVGTIAESIKEQVKKYANDTLGLRMEYSGSDKTYDVFVLCNPGYVCRSISEGKSDDCPYYRIAIERLN